MSRYRSVLVVFLLCCASIGSVWASGGLFAWDKRAPQFLDADQVFTLAPVRQEGDVLTAAGLVAEGYYLYRHAIRLVDAQGGDIPLDLPLGAPKHDEFFGDTEIYTGDTLRLRFPAATAGPLTLHWQGCAEDGICYPPQTLSVALPAGAAGAGVTPLTSPVPPSAALAEDVGVARQLAALGPVAGTLLFFGFGLLLAFTPCTLPMIPIVSSMVVGSQAAPRRALGLSLAYVLAMAAAYAVVGVMAGLAGANLQAALQSPWLLGAFAALFLLLASSLFGLFELRLPSVLVDRLSSSGAAQGGSLGGAAALGVLSALLVGPCMTAPLAGALLYIGQTGSALHGGLVLFALGLGMGLPLLAIALFGARVLPRPGPWMERIRIAFGYLMVGMAIMMLARFLPATISLALWGFWALSVAIGLIAWAQGLAARQRLAWTVRVGAAISGVWSVLMLVGAASGGDSVLQPLTHLRGVETASAATRVNYVAAKSIEDVDARLAEAAARGQWTLIDFYADWCVSCHVIERNVFGDPAVAARLVRMQVLRPDVTRNDATDQALLKHWGVMGPPTLILVGPDGQERRALRVVGEISARDFLNQLLAAGIR